MHARRPPRVEPRQLTAGTAALALGVTMLVVVVTPLRFAYRAPELHLVLETAEGCVALAVAYLVAGRFREHRRWQELLLVLGLSVLAVTNLLLSAVPLALAGGEELDRWAPLLVRLVGTVLVAAAALAPDDAVVDRGVERRVVLAATAVLVLLGLGGWWAGSSLPPVVDPAVDLSDTRRVLLASHPLEVVAQVMSGSLYAVAAAAFTRRAGQDTQDETERASATSCPVRPVVGLAR